MTKIYKKITKLEVSLFFGLSLCVVASHNVEKWIKRKEIQSCCQVISFIVKYIFIHSLSFLSNRGITVFIFKSLYGVSSLSICWHCSIFVAIHISIHLLELLLRRSLISQAFLVCFTVKLFSFCSPHWIVNQRLYVPF